eukprot:TRINITY_DN436_c0_g2_i1.p1 TRINITY_DN436_c0_g2~~TRINITY_DN436_c0_g2_i1.p1  ORF type:complete len:462 (+),score=76.74 TRINITY_DN436_c0_g2_i1:334-1719(+)
MASAVMPMISSTCRLEESSLVASAIAQPASRVRMTSFSGHQQSGRDTLSAGSARSAFATGEKVLRAESDTNGPSHRGSCPGSWRGRRRGSRLVVHADADYYSVLGVSKTADKAEIKSAYRRLARKFHPDVNKEASAESKFKEISNAYEVLSDDEKRGIYDRFGEAGLKGAGQPGGGMGGFNSPFDIFETFFGTSGMGGGGGGRGMRTRPLQGEDQNVELVLDFKEAIFGTSREIEVSRKESCGTCEGSGVKAGTTATSCSTCGGQGQVMMPVNTPLGTFQQVTSCPACDGAGERRTPCSRCSGEGRVYRSKTVKVKVPAGVDTGSALRVRGEGNSGRRGGPPGDLYVQVVAGKDPNLQRSGTTIMCQVKVSYLEAILGTSVSVPTVDGNVELRIPPGTQPATTLVMGKRGVPVLGKEALRGDQLVKVMVEIPKRVSGDERKLLEDLAELSKTGSNKTAGIA